jgi:Flp pilus assembly protein TadD
MPENAKYRANMAVALGLMGRYEESLSLFKQVLPKDQANHNLSVLREAEGTTRPSPATTSKTPDLQEASK